MKSVFIIIFAFLTAMFSGCATKIEAPVVRPWEGRYESEKAAIDAV